MILKIHLIFLLTIFSSNIYAQTSEISDNNAHSHEHYKNEIGAAYSGAYFINEEVLAHEIHLHYVRSLSESFGFGLGYERIFDEHNHQTIGLIGTYLPVENLSFSISPGLSFEDNAPQPKFALHLETMYEFEVSDFHIGPALEFAYDSEDIHLSLGLHIGFGF